MEKPPFHPFTDIPQAKIVYTGKRFSVYHAETPSKNGKLAKRDAVIHPGAVVILPILEDGEVVMIRNERIVVGKILWELPAGTLEPEEPPLETAHRELIEETGYQASNMSFLASFYTSPGICDEKIFAYMACNLNYQGQKLDDTEDISVEILPWAQILAWIKDGTIQDGKTISTLLYYQTYFL